MQHHGTRRLSLLTLLFASILLGWTAVATAQTSNRGRTVTVQMVGSDRLLQFEEVRAELDLSAQQLERLGELEAKAKRGMQEVVSQLQALDPAQRSARMEEYQKKARALQQQFEQEVAAMLTTPQRERLTQLRMQVLVQQVGESNLLISEQLSQRLALSDAQRSQIRAVEQKIQQELRAQLRKLRDEARSEVMDVLTAEQRAQWLEIIGERFEFPEPEVVDQPGE